MIPAAGLALGIALSRWMEFDAPSTVAALAAISALAVVAQWRGYCRAARTGVFAAAWCAGVWTEIAHRPEPAPFIDFNPGETMIVEGCVVEPPSLFPGKERFVVELDRRARIQVSIYLQEGDTPPDLHYGQFIEMDVRLRHPHNYRNPGAFDFAGYLARRDIHWTGSANARAPVAVKGSCGNPLLARIYRLREAALARLDVLYAGDPYATGMTRAVLLGDVARMDQEWADPFRRTGSYHALVISGLHVTTLAACLLFVLRLLPLGPGWSLVAASALGWIYAIAAGFTAPVIRAAAGLTLFQIAHCFHRRPRVLNLLAAVSIGFLLVDPWQLFDASFQLTFLAVAMIAAIGGPWLDQASEPYHRGFRAIHKRAWDRHLEPRVAELRVELRLLAETGRWVTRLPDRVWTVAFEAGGRAAFFLWNLVAISAVVQAGLTLPMAVYFHRVPVTGLTANLAIVPLMNLVTPLGFLAIATGHEWPAKAAAVLLRASQFAAGWHAAREPSWRVPGPPAWLAWLFLASLALAAWAILTRRRLPAVPFVAVWAAVVVHPFDPDIARGKLEVSAIDVGQGDSLLLVSPAGRVMLVDTGGFPKFRNQKTVSRFDVGEEVVTPYLLGRSIRRVDVIALTHAHEDHIGGFKAVVENFRPREIWTGAFPSVDAVRALGVPVRSPKAGESLDWDGVAIEFLWPPADYEPRQAASNNDSLVFRARFGERSFLLTGDIERAMEYRLVNEGSVSRADVLKVAHHGSKTSTTAAFLDAVKPSYAIVSDGIDNLFRHPHPDVVRRLEESGAALFRTDRHGLVTFRTDGRRIEVEPYVPSRVRPDRSAPPVAFGQ